MIILALLAAITLLTLGITRAVHRDWRRSFDCLVVGALIFVLLLIIDRHFYACVKNRAKAYALTHPRVAEQTPRRETGRPSNQVSATSEPAPGAFSSVEME